MSMIPKDKELVAIAISVAAGCKPCTDHHVKVARKARATDDEIREVIVDAIEVRRHSADVMEAYALAHLGQDRNVAALGGGRESNRINALVLVGSAFAVNCVSTLEGALAAAGYSGATQDDISQVANLAIFIKKKAASHVERLVGMPQDEAVSTSEQ